MDDALRSDPGDRFDMVLTNPPFGKKGDVERDGVAAPALRPDSEKVDLVSRGPPVTRWPAATDRTVEV